MASQAPGSVQRMSSILSAMPKGSLHRAFPTALPAARSYSTALRLAPFALRPSPANTSRVGFSQQRTLFGSSWGQTSNRNMLAYMEQTANNNPGSATAQNAF
ncbi:hypothetical protein KC334_g8604, partial [Hortaea werneckii]